MHTKLFEDRGGIILEENEYLKSKRSIINPLLTRFNNAYVNIPDIEFVFINNNEFNAFASVVNNKYYIGINYGVLLILDDIFLKYFSNSGILDHIGDSTSEKQTEYKLSILKLDSSIQFFELSEPLSILPSDKKRLYNAHLLSDLSLSFIIHHELCHIFRGHINFLTKESHKSDFTWDESSITSKEEQLLDKFLLFQTLEMDSDSFATNHAFNVAHHFISTKVFNKNSPIFLTIRSFLCHWSFAIYTIFRLQSFDSFDFAIAKTKKHPPASIRMNLILSNIASILIENNEPDTDDILNDIIKFLISSEKSFLLTTFSEVEIDTFFETLINLEMQEYMNEIRLNWNFVYHKLNNHTFLPLPPLAVE